MNFCFLLNLLYLSIHKYFCAVHLKEIFNHLGACDIIISPRVYTNCDFSYEVEKK